MSLHEGRSGFGHPETSNQRGRMASESRATFEHPPRKLQEIPRERARSGIAALDAKPTPKSSQNRKKSSQNCSQDGSWGTQNRLKITPGTLSGCPMVPKSVRKAPGECLGSILGCPRRAPGAPGGSVKSTQNRAWSAQSSPGSVFQAILIACAVWLVFFTRSEADFL